MSRHLLSKILVAMMMFLSLTAPVAAVNRVWNSSTSNYWTAGPWLPDSTPTSADSVTFNSAATYSVYFDAGAGDMTVNDLFVTGGDVNFRILSGPTRSVHLNGTGGLHDVTIGPGRLTLGVGGATVLDMVDQVNIDDGGILAIENGSMVDAEDLNVGMNSSAGTLNIANGGSVTLWQAYIGLGPDSAGIVNVAGATMSNEGGVWVGFHGDGTLNISQGGQVYGPGGTIGLFADSTGTVTVDNAVWNNNFSINVGTSGDGTLDITNGGQVTNDICIIGQNSDSTGTVTVDNAVWTNTKFLNVGHGGAGNVSITNDGQVTSKGGTIGLLSGSTGTVTVDGAGSVWTNDGALTVGDDGEGTLDITNGGTVQTPNLIVGANGQLKGDGNIVGNVQNAGVVSPGTSPSALNVTGNYTQAAGAELTIELASASVYDQLLVIGDATLAGRLTVNLLDGYIPAAGQSFTILTTDDVDDTFAMEALPSVPNLAFDVIYNAQSVVLTVLSTLPGDYSGNGTVDAADYTIWRDSVGGFSLRNEGASPGTVDYVDYDFWKLHFGETAGSGSAGASPSQAAVPEPATTMLLMFAAAGWCLRRRGTA